MIEKLNNREYIYRNMQLFYKYVDDEILKSILENFIYNILNEILFNISIEDLEKLLQTRKEIKSYNALYIKNQTKKILDILNEKSLKIHDISIKNANIFLNEPYETIEESIFILF